MKLVVLTADGPEHRFVVNRLCRELPIAAVVVDERVRTPSLRRAFRNGFRRGLGRVGLFAYRRLVGDERAYSRALESVLGDAVRAFDRDDLVRVDGINSAAALQTVRALQPDAIAVYGTTIVRDPMLSLARDLAFNMHTGISPRYRGTDCAFWPVVNGEPEWIGATVHECTSAVDGGRIFATSRAEWKDDDGLHELFARAVATGADLYVHTLHDYLAAGDVAGEAQNLSSGREYRGSMRTLGAELRARRALRKGLLQHTRSANLEDLQRERGTSVSTAHNV
jgi:folate-dependent phosphoribosylglycinamide formyltransferase PurN